ncbi:hypothetical protein F4678DRAFT_472834 [Xylaria arbuscula]|nr:hypothetical protein F4678DRAFT_472834 [Xylaria arbuscula]
MSQVIEAARVTLFGSSNAGKHSFEPARDIPSLSGKVVLITGPAGDLGRQTVVELARYSRPARIYVADLPRDAEARKEVIECIQSAAQGDGQSRCDSEHEPTEVRFLGLDLTEQRIDILEGHQKHFGLNYLGHALLSRLLLPSMLSTVEQHPGADLRVVVVSSEGHAVAPAGGIQFDKLRTDCADMVRFFSFCVHPGRIITGMTITLSNESLLVRLTAPVAPLVCVPVSVGIKNHLWGCYEPQCHKRKILRACGSPRQRVQRCGR